MNGFFEYPSKPRITAFAAHVGKKEKHGPIGERFEEWCDDTALACQSWEKAESRLQLLALDGAVKKRGCETKDIEIVFGGDLQAQCTATHYAARETQSSFIGLYGACSTMTESLMCAGAFVNAGYADMVAAMTSSHFCAAERQFRFPLEYGGMRTPTAQWTVSGAGCCIVENADEGIYIKNAQAGRIIDYGITDINNMGAAMAPAAADAYIRYFAATGTRPEDYDLVVTGDLGLVGSKLFLQLMRNEGLPVRAYRDCGLTVFNPEKDKVNAGGSGCGCCASVLCAQLLPDMKSGAYGNILVAATGALMSSVTFLQKESIPCIAHVVNLVYG